MPALMETMAADNVFLKTFATATLVNISDGSENVKSMLIREGVMPLVAEHLRIKDDDLVQYSLRLLTNLSKSQHQRCHINECGVIEVLMDFPFCYNIECGSLECMVHNPTTYEHIQVFGQPEPDEIFIT